MDLKEIKAIIDLMKKNSISEFEVEEQGLKLRLRRTTNGGAGNYSNQDEAPAPAASILVPAPVQSPAQVNLPTPTATGDIEIKSPMIGTFYRAPSPEAANYAEIGSEVNSDTVVCIIEAMKVMNEIKAEVKGVITQVLVENGKPVEFGQPLFKIRPI